MTYNELKKILDNMTSEELNQTATVYLNYEDEFAPISSVLVAQESDILDDGHIYFSA